MRCTLSPVQCGLTPTLQAADGAEAAWRPVVSAERARLDCEFVSQTPYSASAGNVAPSLSWPSRPILECLVLVIGGRRALANWSITLSTKEADCVATLPAVVKRRMRQREAADRLGLTALQVRRLLQRDRRSGPAVRVSRRHDQDSGNPIPVAAQKAMLERIRERYPDVPAKLAWESWYSRTDRDGLRQEPTIIVLG